MARWQIGAAEVEAMIANGEIQSLVGEAARGDRLVAKAARTAETARSIVAADPDSAVILAYDAARQALTGLLAQQGLRPTTDGGHVAVERGRQIPVRPWVTPLRRTASTTQRAAVSAGSRGRCDA